MKNTFTVKAFKRSTGTYDEMTVKSMVSARKEFMKIISNKMMAQILKNGEVIADSHPSIIKVIV